MKTKQNSIAISSNVGAIVSQIISVVTLGKKRSDITDRKVNQATLNIVGALLSGNLE